MCSCDIDLSNLHFRQAVEDIAAECFASRGDFRRWGDVILTKGVLTLLKTRASRDFWSVVLYFLAFLTVPPAMASGTFSFPRRASAARRALAILFLRPDLPLTLATLVSLKRRMAANVVSLVSRECSIKFKFWLTRCSPGIKFDGFRPSQKREKCIHIHIRAKILQFDLKNIERDSQ